MKKLLNVILVLLLSVINVSAQDGADFMRSIGKMYVVVGVIALIFIGIVVFLIYMDRKLTKLEDQIE